MSALVRPWKQLAHGLATRPFLRNVLTVATGTAASQAIVMAFTPIITRLYGPEAFGLNGVFMSVVTPLAVLAALGYPIAIVLPRHDRDALALGWLSGAIGLAIALLTTIFLMAFGAELLALLNASEISAFMYLVPVAMFFSVLGEVLRNWLIRRKAYGVTAKYGVFTTLLVNITKSGLGLLYPTATVLIVTNVMGQLLSTCLTFFGWRRHSAAEPAPRVAPDRAAMLAAATQHRDFPLLRTPQNLINVASKSLPLLLLAAYFDAGAAGQYAIAMAVLGLPVTLIGGSVLSVFYPRINEAILDGEDARALVVKTTLAMAAVGVLPFLPIVLAGPLLFEFVFGAGWETAGSYAQWLSLWLFAAFANRPAVSAIPALKLQGFLLVHEIVSVFARVSALYIGFVALNDAVAGIAAFGVVGMVLNAFLISYVIRRTPRAGASS